MNLLVFSHKICWYSPDSPTGVATDGGFAMHMDALASKFDRVTIITALEERKPTGEVYFTAGNIDFIFLKEWVDPVNATLVKIISPFWFLRYFNAFVLKTLSADAVHIPVPSHIGFIGMFFSLLFKKKLYVRHCGNWLQPKTRTEKILKWVMIKTGGGRRVYLATGGSAAPPSEENDSIHWIFSSSIKREEFAPAALAKTPPERPVLKLIHVARQEVEKGAMEVINALPLLKQDFPQVQLTIVGEGNGMAKIRACAEATGCLDSIVFKGKCNHDEVLESLTQADIFCYPTRASEGFPKVVLEAMSLGLPVVTTPVSILAQLIPSSGAGVLVENTKPETLYKAIRDIAANPAVFSRMSEAGRTSAVNYSLESWADAIEKELVQAWKAPLRKN